MQPDSVFSALAPSLDFLYLEEGAITLPPIIYFLEKVEKKCMLHCENRPVNRLTEAGA